MGQKGSNKKRGRGRPLGSKNKIKFKHRGRGRPKGSKNKVKKAKGIVGRPRGSKNKHFNECPTEKMFLMPKDYKAPKSKKFLGYCRCDFMINEGDLVSALMCVCPGCGRKSRVSKLKKEIKIEIKTKKEYLEDAVFNSRVIEQSVGPVREEPEEVPEIEEIIEEEKKSEKEDDIIK
jgi:hypothetical protein